MDGSRGRIVYACLPRVAGASFAMDPFLNVFFFGVHTAWMVFVCVGWTWRRTRPAHAAVVALTALSWFGLGLWRGWGYCPFTDWHWRVRERLGYMEHPPSYLQLLASEMFGLELPLVLANAVAVVVLATAALMTLVLNVRDFRTKGS